MDLDEMTDLLEKAKKALIEIHQMQLKILKSKFTNLQGSEKENIGEN